MNEDEILARIRDIFQDNFGIEPSKVTPEAHLYEDLDLDSIDEYHASLPRVESRAML